MMTRYTEIDGIGEVVPRSEYDALAAQVEALREAYAAYVESGFNEILEDAFEATPQQHIAEIRAQAVQDFIQFMYSQDNCQLCNSSLDIASKYADRILQEGE